MRNSVLRLFVALMFLVAMGAGRAAAQGAPATPPAPPLSLKVAAYSDGGDIPLKYGCDVEKGAPFITPALTWTNTPKAAVSFVLIMHDMDGAPMKAAQDVTHWTVYNIPATAVGLPEGILPDAAVAGDGLQGKNVRGVNGYQAPCPPKGGPAHHYVFELYAVDAKVDLPVGAVRADILKAIDGHVVGKSSYVGMFHH
jgi:Raf kinase inhibitor-like YbhB/YbcL family protein